MKRQSLLAGMVAGALACGVVLAGCGEQERTTLAFSIGPGSQAQVSEAMEIVGARAEALGAENVEVERASEGPIEVSFAEGTATGESLAPMLAAPLKLRVYDWEPNEIPPGPGDPSHSFGSRAMARAHAQANGGIVLSERMARENPETDLDDSTLDPGHFVIRDRPELTGEQVAGAEQSFDPTTNLPTILVELTPEGQRQLQELIERVAERPRGQPSNPEVGPSAHLAVVLDGAIVSRPVVNTDPNDPDPGTHFQIEGDFTIQEARELAALLPLGELPVRLTPQ